MEGSTVRVRHHLAKFIFAGSLCLTLAACHPTLNRVVMPGTVFTDAPAAVNAALKERWPDYQVIDATGPADCAGRRVGSPARVVAGDFNGDGFQDFSARIKTADGVNVVAAFGRLDGKYALQVVAPDRDNSVLDLAPRGEKYRLADLGIDLFFGVDTIALTRCGNGATAYLWTGASFDPREIE